MFALEATKEQSELMASNDEAFETWLLTEVIDAGEANGDLAGYLAASHAQSLDRYDAEDIATILEDFQAPPPPTQRAANEKFMKRFLWRRNARMVQRMISLLVRCNSFIAIGAAHLPGEKGIVNMLVKRGYKLTRVH
ncbi:MAG: TraB/GumN family protein [Alphaproteobacteria bacterium]